MLRRAWSHVRSQWSGFLALGLVLAGGGAYAAFDPVGSDGDIDACFQKRSGDLDVLKGRKCARDERRVSWSLAGPQGPAGPAGDAGAQGLPGQDATSLFAYVRDPGTGAAVLGYGKGVTAVAEDVNGTNDYRVTFNRDLTNCSAHATAGTGEPPGSASASNAFNRVDITDSSIEVFWSNAGGALDNTSFLLSVFC